MLLRIGDKVECKELGQGVVIHKNIDCKRYEINEITVRFLCGKEVEFLKNGKHLEKETFLKKIN